MNPVQVTKTLAAASSTGIGTVSTAATPVVTLNTSALDTQRRITIFSTSNSLSAVSFTIIGTQQGGGVQRETITGPTSNTAVATTQDFLTVTSVLTSCSAIAAQAVLGTNTTGGSPWVSVNLHVTPINIGAAMTFTSSANGMTGSIDITHDDPFWLFAGAGAPGGIPTDLDSATPLSFTSTAFNAASTNTWAPLNIYGGGAGTMVPITAWRLTMTSSNGSSAGTITVTAVQAGIG